MKLKKSYLLFSACVGAQVFAQDTIRDTIQETIEIGIKEEPKKEVSYPKFKLGGVFQARFLNNFKKGVDVNGLEHTTGRSVNNTFEVKRMRVSLNAKLSENLEVNTLVNFADFKSDPKTKVLENAFAKYTVNRYLQLQIGQFRPAFGLEDAYAVDIVKSLDFSNSYYLMGSNGWQSFQIGAAASGNVDLGKVPLYYAVTVTNGNGKNTLDDDNGKHYSGRFYFLIDKTKNFQLGFSSGIGEEKEKKIYAFAVEGTYRLDLTPNWALDFQAEGFQATNQVLYFSDLAKLNPEEGSSNDLRINDYILKGFYVMPNLRYEVGKKHFQALELSLRYEYLDASTKINSNPRQTWTPMVSLEFLKNYGARIQLGVQIDNYKKNIINTKTYNSSLGFVQFQCRL